MLKVKISKDKTKLIKQIAALEYLIKNDTNPKDKSIHQQALKDLEEQLLYIEYLGLQSNEWKKNILGYEHFEQEGHEIIIRVNLIWGWLRVYRTIDNEIEWY